MNRKDLEFRYGLPPKDQSVWVSVNSRNSYSTTMKHLQALLAKLKKSISFSFKIISEPQVKILAGKRVSGMASVEMKIRYRISDQRALAKLKARKFFEGFELVR